MMYNKILVLFGRNLREQIGNSLALLPIQVYFADTLAELTELVQDGQVFQVAILPATLPEAEATCWEVYGGLSLLNTKPELLICAHAVSFRLWSSVLDAGGHDILVEPFSPEQLQGAVLHALKSFQERSGSSRSGAEQPIT